MTEEITEEETIIIKRKGQQISVEIKGWNFIGILNYALTPEEVRVDYLIDNFLLDLFEWKKSDKFALNKLTNPVTLYLK